MKVLTDADQLYEAILAVAEGNQEPAKNHSMVHNQANSLILPLVQNQEACVYGAVLSRQKGYWAPGTYPYESLESLWEQMKQWDDGYLLKDERAKALLQVIERFGGKLDTKLPYEEDLAEMSGRYPFYLEVTAPFSVLTSLIPPMKVYGAMRKKNHPVLEKILNWLSYDLACYIKEAIAHGCKVISLADPTGSMKLLGERSYNQWVAPWEVQLLKMCEGVLMQGRAVCESSQESAGKVIEDYLNGAVIHLCGKMSSDLVNQGWMKVCTDPDSHSGSDCHPDSDFYVGSNSCLDMKSQKQLTGTYLERLIQTASNGKITYAGLGCIRNGDSKARIVPLTINKLM